MNIEPGKIYGFKRLEAALREYEIGERAVFVVEDIDAGERAFMHTFSGNFCGDWRSGDGILFYESHEEHSANPNALFKLLKVIEISQFDNMAQTQ